MGILNIFDEVAEQHIQKAMAEGQFDNLPGKGRPLVLEDDSMIPPDLRMAYKILKNSGHIPEEVAQEKEIAQALDLLADCKDEKTRYQQICKINFLVLKINEQRKKPIALERHQVYFEKTAERVTVRETSVQDRRGQ